MPTTPDHGYELIPDGTTPWGSDYRSMVSSIDLRLPYATAQMYAVNNASATTVSVVDTWYKANVTTTAGLLSTGFTHTSNRLTYATSATSARRLLVTGNFHVIASNNQTVEVGLGLNGSDPAAAAVTVCRVGSSGNENGAGVGLLDLEDGDYFEIYVRNRTGAANITLADISVVVFG
jgi:hypothetical protein